jgi:IS30 family transposase
MTIEYVPYNLTDEQVRELWDRYARGETASALGRRFGKSANSMSERIRLAGGIRPTMPTRAARHLTLEDREEISRGLAADHSIRAIATRLGRCPSTISREVNTNGGRGRYRASTADRAAIERRKATSATPDPPGPPESLTEGDLILGKGMSAIGTLVERSTRFLMLIHLERIKSEHVVGELTRHVQTLPEQLRRSVTWDQGKEMALHANFTIDTGIQVYFCDPKSPWQRGTNENTNGLLRQYFPKRSDLKPYSQADLDAIAAELNGRPRKTLEFMTPSEKFAEAVATTR